MGDFGGHGVSASGKYGRKKSSYGTGMTSSCSQGMAFTEEPEEEYQNNNNNNNNNNPRYSTKEEMMERRSTLRDNQKKLRKNSYANHKNNLLFDGAIDVISENMLFENGASNEKFPGQRFINNVWQECVNFFNCVNNRNN